ncbi:MAG: SusC/RagA family TonB-linked outer membrane protein, partial [Bacteroidales bacterium]|nr:SusC/RagA family TonB-linked outer membrane protein [Bacteroidales bacterium]
NTNTDVPALNASDTYASNYSTRYVISSNYLALNNVTFGYTVPRSLTSKLFLETVRVYFTADGVALWSKREGLDPRQSFTSATTSTYTSIRSISGGIKITF